MARVNIGGINIFPPLIMLNKLCIYFLDDLLAKSISFLKNYNWVINKTINIKIIKGKAFIFNFVENKSNSEIEKRCKDVNFELLAEITKMPIMFWKQELNFRYKR